jgi:hypothetical protein
MGMSSTRRGRSRAAVLAVALFAIAAGFVLLRGIGGDDGGALAVSAKAKGQCDATTASLEALEADASSALPDTTICLADGSFGDLKLSADARGRGVTVRPAHPGKATLASADLSGSHISLARFQIDGEVTIEPGSRKIAIEYNRVSGGYMGINAGPTTSTPISDTTIRGNQLVGPFGEDALRINRYHDSADADPYGILIEGNEIAGVRENGNHSDCLQSVWGGDGLYFRRNYLHDNRCQGFFVKDQPAPVRRVVVADNLMLRDAAPCASSSPDCGAPSVVSLYGPIRGLRLAHNTIWTAGNRSPVVWGEGPFEGTAVEDNVLYRAWSEWDGGFPGFSESDDLVCQWEGTLPSLSHSAQRGCKPGFRGAGDDDYRLRHSDAGIDWSPSEQHYGP